MSEPALTPLARMPVFAAMAALAVTLTVVSQAYGFHRDELYFRMLEPAWGYVDSPPLIPLLASAMTAIVDEPWMLRLPATFFAVAGVLVAALIARETGGGRGAQALAAWGVAGAAFPLTFGHVLLTATADLLVWPLVCLLAIRAVHRARPRWWLAAGLTVGLSSFSKLLVAVLVAGIAVGILVVGPRRVLASPFLWAGLGVAAVLSAPNIAYQVMNDWPQLRMGAALSENNADEVRVLMWPFLLLLLGPLLVPTWIAGIVAAVRMPTLRFLVAASVVVVAFTFAGGSQFYYPLGILTVLYAIGCVRVAGMTRRWVPAAAIAVNSVVSAIIALPLIPLGLVGITPVPAINQIARDSIGWERYVAQIARTVASAHADAVIATNYGEAGAIDRYGPALGIPAVYSGHNALGTAPRPPESAHTVVVVGDQVAVADRYFDCVTVVTLDAGVGVDNEEQGEPVAVCRDRAAAWERIWPEFAHLD